MKHVPRILAIALAIGSVKAAGEPTQRPLTVSNMRYSVRPLPPVPELDMAKVAIGERLFHDPRLSLHGHTSCQSCHDISANGASARRFDLGDDGTAMQLNTPTVFNSALNFHITWTGRTATATQMTAASLRNPHIMGGDGPGIRRLRGDATLADEVRTAYHRDLDEAVAIDGITEYLRSLTTPDARFDQWLSGNAKALNGQELRGWARFQSVGCVSCHQGVNIGGNLLERHGIFHRLASPNPAILRVPSLRNVATTAPYFHDGSAPDLFSAVISMAHAQLDITLDRRDLNDIVAFLRTLTGRYKGQPVQARRR